MKKVMNSLLSASLIFIALAHKGHAKEELSWLLSSIGTTISATRAFPEDSYDMLEEDEDEEEDDEYNYPLPKEEDESSIWGNQQKMEAPIDYNDRTRTDRERKALNTSSHASDDE